VIVTSGTQDRIGQSLRFRGTPVALLARMRPTIILLAATLVAGCSEKSDGVFTTGGDNVPVPPGETRAWSFDDDGSGVLPSDFEVVLGEWAVASDGGSPSAPNVMRQSGTYDDPDFPRVVVRNLAFADFNMSTRCIAESGDVDQACGLMFRFQDSDNYLLTRANALENNVRIYHVVDGVREQTASASLEVTAGEWHTLGVSAHGADIRVSWDGAEVVTVSDDLFVTGKIGLWTKADSVTAFDDLEATAD
jgi:hypothetical protein